MIKLHELDPDAVADEVLGWVAFQGRYLPKSSPMRSRASPADWLAEREDIRMLTTYAQSGHMANPRRNAGELAGIVATLIHSAPYPDHDLQSSESRGDPKHAIDAVICAALARLRIECGSDVPVAWVAILAGMKTASLRTYATTGRGRTLAIKRGLVSAKDAKAWLHARGVPGVGP